VPEKCILEAFGTGVPNGNVTVKKTYTSATPKLFICTLASLFGTVELKSRSLIPGSSSFR